MIELLKKLKLWDAISSRKGLDTELNGKATNFSGGEKRKIYLAMALSKDSDVLILDEISANVDQETIGIIYEVLKEKRDSRNQLVVAISHDKCLNGLYDLVIDMNSYKY